MTATAKVYDFVVFGAAGFAGYHVALTMARNCGAHSWAVAGRNLEKLDSVLKKISIETENENVLKIDKIEADCQNIDSLRNMASKAKVVLNCVGPYRFFGEPVVKACIDQGVSYVDISGEPIFLERVALLYDELAKNRNCYVISACGFDCIPCEMGVDFARKNFEGTLNSVEIYHQVSAPNGVTINFGTLKSAIYGIANEHELKDIRKSMSLKNHKSQPKLKPKISMRGNLFYNQDIKAWCLPFLGADNSVLRRSMTYEYENNDKRPIQTQVYMAFSSIFTCLALMFFGAMFMVLCKYRFGRFLFENYPQYMTFGLFTKRGPSDLQLKTTTFKTTIIGNGWSNRKLGSDESSDNTEPEDKIVCVVKGGELGYVATSAMMVASALTLLEQKDKLPKPGVLTPACAFSDTNLIETLIKMGVAFEKL